MDIDNRLSDLLSVLQAEGLTAKQLAAMLCKAADKLYQPDVVKFARAPRSYNGNPRRVVHFLAFATETELKNSEPCSYEQALKRARPLGGKKYHNKQYAGGILFECYDLGYVLQRMREITGRDLIMEQEG